MTDEAWAERDPELAECLHLEQQRQTENLEMIASESIQFAGALALAGSAFNNKTAVGLPEKQRLKGSQYAARLEQLAAERACRLFGADHANMLPYSGSTANYCAYSACLNLGDRVLSMNPAAGAHQTHGLAANISSRLYQFDYFGLNRDTLLLDYEEAERKAREFRPKLIVAGSASYSRIIDYARLAEIAHRNGARLMVDMAHFSGLVAAGVLPSPVPYADVVTASSTKTMCGAHSGFILCKEELARAVDEGVYPRNVASVHLQTIAATAYTLRQAGTDGFRLLMRKTVENAQYFCGALQRRGFGIVSGGTDCHMFVADLRPFGGNADLTANRFEEIGITVNTKAIPFDTASAPRGLRAGLTVLTQRGFDFEALDGLAELWHAITVSPDDPDVLENARKQVLALSARFPVPPEYGC